jgi:hypothetical protein
MFLNVMVPPLVTGLSAYGNAPSASPGDVEEEPLAPLPLAALPPESLPPTELPAVLAPAAPEPGAPPLPPSEEVPRAPLSEGLDPLEHAKPIDKAMNATTVLNPTIVRVPVAGPVVEAEAWPLFWGILCVPLAPGRGTARV